PGRLHRPVDNRVQEPDRTRRPSSPHHGGIELRQVSRPELLKRPTTQGPPHRLESGPIALERLGRHVNRSPVSLKPVEELIEGDLAWINRGSSLHFHEDRCAFELSFPPTFAVRRNPFTTTALCGGVSDINDDVPTLAA